MRLHIPRRARRQLDDRKLIAWVAYLAVQRHRQRVHLQQRAERWPDLPAGVEGFPIGGKTR